MPPVASDMCDTLPGTDISTSWSSMATSSFRSEPAAMQLMLQLGGRRETAQQLRREVYLADP